MMSKMTGFLFIKSLDEMPLRNHFYRYLDIKQYIKSGCFTIMKIYTKGGDSGMTGLQGGKRVSKSSRRIAAYGSLDEANAIIGMAIATGTYEQIQAILNRIQNDLFILGADMSNPDLTIKTNRITTEMITSLEHDIDEIDKTLPPLTNFILPGGTVTGSILHVARAVVRRAETHMAHMLDDMNPLCLVYVNRLSDLLFVLARASNVGKTESIWRP